MLQSLNESMDLFCLAHTHYSINLVVDRLK